MSRTKHRIPRRKFLARSAAAVGGLVLARGARARNSPNSKLNVAVVGAGGRGADNLHDLEPTGVNIVALCDCDQRRAASSFANYPQAKRYSDWRRMLDKSASEIDAVLAATPDHNHAIISIAAMKLGKHVYCEKPLAHSIWEAREMARVATEAGVATQMGTQGHAYEGTRRAVEVIRSGAIGQVRELHVWTDRPARWWAQGIDRPAETPPVPDGLDWDVWLGPAPARPYNPAYLPLTWRGWWDFGTGAIGDMGIHNLDTAFWALELTPPTSVKIKDCSPALTEPSAKETAPLWSMLEFQFPARKAQPPVAMHWYDGGKMPPAELLQGVTFPNRDGGSLIVGSKGTLITRTWHGGQSQADMFVLLPQKRYEGFQLPARSLPRVQSHHHEWVSAAKGDGKTLSNFAYASALTESLLLGDLALRVGKDLQWDSANLRSPGCEEADSFIKPTFRTGWK